MTNQPDYLILQGEKELNHDLYSIVSGLYVAKS